MQHAIEACAKVGAKLVFFDNVYLYGRVQGAMTEQSPRNPCSRKGQVRAQVVQMLEQAMLSGKLQALIARAPDFYGTGTSNSMVNMVVLQRMALGKRPMWIGKPEVPHTFIFTQDAAKATALLANTDMAYGQTWHLPVVGNISGQEMAQLAARQLSNANARLNVMPSWMLSLASVFNSILRENQEMMYQYNEPYLFDSAKFLAAFPKFAVTSYKEGISQTLAAFAQAEKAH
jgi:nucleoside-diphosphate-sugar epimerase